METIHKNETKAALGYLRISDKKQIKGESKHNQRAAIESYAKANGIRVVKWFYDEARSGKNTEREELQNLLKTALKMKGSISYVLVYKMNRASRNLESYVIGLRSVLASRGIEVRSVTEPFDDSPMGRFMENLYVMVGQLDNDNKRETVIDNMTRIAQQGYWQHKPIRGYKMVKLNNSEGQPRPSMQPNEEAEKVTDILLRFNKGDITEAKLARYATSIGFIGVNKKPISQEVIHKMLTRPEYAGYVHDGFTNFELVEGKHPSLIPKEVFWQNQHIIKRKNKEYLIGIKHLESNNMYPLRRFILCVNCKKPMTSCAPSNSPRYFCPRATCRGTGSMLASKVHNNFEKLLRSIEPNPSAIKEMKDIIKGQAVKELSQVNKDIAKYRDRLDDLAEIRTNAIKKFISGKISEDEKQLVIDDIDEEKLDLVQELDALEQQQNIGEANIEYALNFMADVAKLWADASLELKQKYQNAIFPKGFILDIQNDNFIISEISPLYSLVSNAIDPLKAKNSIMVIPRGIEPLLPG